MTEQRYLYGTTPQIRIKTDLAWSGEKLAGGEAREHQSGHWAGAMGQHETQNLHPLQLEWDQFLSHRLGQRGGWEDTVELPTKAACRGTGLLPGQRL